MKEDLKDHWRKIDSLSKNEIKDRAREELLDIKGLSAVRNILCKYNLTNVCIDFRLNLAFKRSPKDNPKKYFEKQGKG